MIQHDIKEHIFNIIESIIKDNFMELIDIEFLGNDYLRVIIDKNGGITLDDCSLLSRQVNTALNLYGYNFSLEVSSPGIDRPLKKINDFEKFIGKKAKIITRESIKNKNVFKGVIERVINEVIIIRNDSGIVEIDFNNIKKANLIGEIIF